jgi:hypothetical protein
MRRTTLLICLSLLALPLAPLAQGPMLLDPAKAPMTLKGGWIHQKTGDKNDLVIKIEAIQPDGTFTGRIDFYNTYKAAACKLVNEPIKEGKVTDKTLRVVAEGPNPNTCPKMVLIFNPGSAKFLEGQMQQGHKMWLDAPK